MPKLQLIISLLVFFVAGSPLAFSQALLPYAIEPELEQMEQAGIEMAEDAIQLARFRRTDAALGLILGSLYLQDDQVQPGIEALNQSLSLAPADAHANIKFSLGSAYFQNQDYKSAIAQIEAGLQMKPDISPALFDLGNSYLKLAQYPQAIAAYEKAVSQDKNFWPAINNIGLVKYEQGDKEAALKDWRAALKIDPKQAEPQLAIAVAIYSQGKTEEGIKLAQAALTSDSRYVSLKFLEENLWGQRLLQDTEKMFNHPKMKDFIARLPQPTPEVEEEN
ncbi:MAG: tetratricopeptide repeat protein [Microcystis sp. 53602_E8]|nr:tetratricopeptide repeat protein [Microcystis sp. 53602_E8]